MTCSGLGSGLVDWVRSTEHYGISLNVTKEYISGVYQGFTSSIEELELIDWL